MEFVSGPARETTSRRKDAPIVQQYRSRVSSGSCQPLDSRGNKMRRKTIVLGFMVITSALLTMPIAQCFAQGGERTGERSARGGERSARGGERGRGGEGGRRGKGERGRRGEGGPRGHGAAASRLLSLEKVRQELEITEEQVEAIKKAMQELRSERGERDRERPNFREMSEDDRLAFRKRIQVEAEERAKKAKEKLSDILLPHQMERLEQIAIQAQGIGALRNQELAKKLDLTEDQKAAIKKDMEDARDGIREKMREMFQGDGGDAKTMREKMRELMKEVEEKALLNLSDEQKEKLEELKGEKFELPVRDFFGGRRGGGERRGRGRGRGGDRGDRPSRPERPERPEVD